MDNATLTVLGMIAAFVTAFLAEPVKIYFETKRKESDFRKALYGELLENYHLFMWSFRNTDKFQESALHTTSEMVSNEVYKQIRQNEFVLYFKMYDSSSITMLNSIINKSIKISGTKKSESTKLKIYQLNAWAFVEAMSFFVYKGYLERKIIKNLLNVEEYLEFLEIGNKVNEKGYSINSLGQLNKLTPKKLMTEVKTKNKKS